ncbi:hypothetical protein M6B38_251515 [Iris pallida]|uniref:Uncharacterized protein n=1 Tax=Iris pallida TaxID=29817 RepID=A0AAX6IIM8_IRIPA|nr:hypothetical protein M6B38_251515 [Iris pallida]
MFLCFLLRYGPTKCPNGKLPLGSSSRLTNTSCLHLASQFSGSMWSCDLDAQVNLLKNKFGFDDAFNDKEDHGLTAALKRLQNYKDGLATCQELLGK